MIENHFTRFGVGASFVDSSNLGEVRRAFRPDTRLVSVEPPSNPSMQVSDMMIDLGCNMDPHQAFLVLRGPKTLGIRVEFELTGGWRPVAG